ncbi:hypothetical protein AVEN_135162-1 [Araneus ventricosus]|uniref:Uncharacterized protein n=1 Tax=Araneus ventricosus TaxID=182803 RepID=A0A4Y2UCC5_ARAVE|nr:hypothetical protein AVEN_135162-1 [Araneus ventricosus]
MWIRAQELPLYNLKVIVSGTRNALNIITCNLSSNDGHPLWGAPSPKREWPYDVWSNRTWLGQNNVSLFTFCSAQESETRGPPGSKGNCWILIH